VTWYCGFQSHAWVQGKQGWVAEAGSNSTHTPLLTQPTHLFRLAFHTHPASLPTQGVNGAADARVLILAATNLWTRQ
jgi:hypothetical protein